LPGGETGQVRAVSGLQRSDQDAATRESQEPPPAQRLRRGRTWLGHDAPRLQLLTGASSRSMTGCWLCARIEIPRFEGAHYSVAGKPGLPVMSYAPPLRRLN